MPRRSPHMMIDAALCELRDFAGDLLHDRIGLAAKRAESLVNIAAQLAIWCYDRQREFDAKAKAVING